MIVDRRIDFLEYLSCIAIVTWFLFAAEAVKQHSIVGAFVYFMFVSVIDLYFDTVFWKKIFTENLAWANLLFFVAVACINGGYWLLAIPLVVITFTYILTKWNRI